MIQATLLLLLWAGTVRADWSYDFVRMTCIPESKYLKLESASVDSEAVLAGQEERRGEKQLRAWQRYGFYVPKHLDSTCRFASGTYRITATATDPQAQGQCGGDPHTTLTVFRDGKPILSGVVFGNSCFEPRVTSAEFSGAAPTVVLHLGRASEADDDKSPVPDKYFFGKDVSAETPIDQSKVRRYVTGQPN